MLSAHALPTPEMMSCAQQMHSTVFPVVRQASLQYPQFLLQVYEMQYAKIYKDHVTSVAAEP